MLSSFGQRHSPTDIESAAVFEASDIPILSSTDRLQRALLSWVDLCGLSGHYNAGVRVCSQLQELGLLDPYSYLLEIENSDITSWSILWSGVEVNFGENSNFEEALAKCVDDHRFAELIVREYLDALRYRRASARRFAHRQNQSIDSMDQLIFPLKDAEKTEFVLVIGEPVSGRTLYNTPPGHSALQETAQ